MRTTEPLTRFFFALHAGKLSVTSLRHGGSCPAAVRPLVCPAFAEAFLLLPGCSSRCPGCSYAPTLLLRRRQQTDTVARTEPGEPSRNIEKSWPSIWPPWPRRLSKVSGLCSPPEGYCCPGTVRYQPRWTYLDGFASFVLYVWFIHFWSGTGHVFARRLAS